MGTEGNPVKAVRDEVIDSFEHSAEIYGLNRSYGRLYGILFFAGGPVSLDELVEESGYAKSTVSTAMKQMEQLHLVYRRSVPGKGRRRSTRRSLTSGGSSKSSSAARSNTKSGL
ncbi:GbsR/MarR family transcriptional regulator [Halorussus caseinilyticus]|uniref:GbsR/MarR family transcriptional regulator n=1 Tax=Halorussus caseinilyticus TaxID=3034025 RepID=A0ABD5WFX5_9EURY